MRGSAYAAGEIIVFLVIAGVIGLAIGLILGWGRRLTAAATADAQETSAAAADEQRRLEARVAELEAELAGSAQSVERVGALEKELSVAQWQIDALEEELSKQSG